MKKIIASISFCLLCLIGSTQDLSVYLIGDAGEPHFPEDANLKFLKQKVADASENDVLIFLGDNLYPKGLPDEEDPERAEMEKKLNAQLDIIKEFKGTSYIIPGNHDWAQGRRHGLEDIRNMEKHVTQYLNNPTVFLPKNGCPGPEEIPLSDKVTLLILDTQYLLHRFDKGRETDGCNAAGTSEALELLNDMVVRNKDKHLLIAAHHPLYSYGPHGGRYNFLKANLFPLTDTKKLKNAYIPLPGLGTIYWVNRAVIGNIQDIPNPRYKIIRNSIVDILSQAENVVWASGHEHSLQYIKRDKTHYVVSGSGSKTSRVVDGPGTVFHQSARGFSQLTYKANGQVSLNFQGGDTQEQLFEQNIYEKQVTTEEEELAKRPTFQGDSITATASSQYAIGKKSQILAWRQLSPGLGNTIKNARIRFMERKRRAGNCSTRRRPTNALPAASSKRQYPICPSIN